MDEVWLCRVVALLLAWFLQWWAYKKIQTRPYDILAILACAPLGILVTALFRVFCLYVLDVDVSI